MIAQHLSNSDKHQTPKHVVDASRRVLGRINLDPASCASANRVVRARRWIGRPRDGLAAQWGGTVFLNPPGGTFTPRRKSTPKSKKGNKKRKRETPKIPIKPADRAHRLKWQTDSRAVAWWRKLVLEYEAGHVTAAIFIGFNLDILQASQKNGHKSPLDYAFCIPRDRLCFGGDQPTHANVIVYLGKDKRRFAREFGELGAVKL